MSQHVFISYRHETLEHARAVRRLGELLRQAKIPVVLDQFYLDEHPGGPDFGWAKWCIDCAKESHCVLIIGSEGWFGAYDKIAAPGVGLGAAAEADVIRQWLFEQKNDNTRIRIAILDNIAPQKVPLELRGWQLFRPFDNDDQLNQLIRWVADCLDLTNLEPPTVSWPKSADYRPNLADRINEWPAVVDLLAGRSRERILLFEGPVSGLGKSALVREAKEYAKTLDIPVVHVDLKGGGLDVAGIMGQFDLDLAQHLRNFSQEGANKTHLLRKDLRALRHPILVILDSYEDVARNRAVSDWLNLQLFTEVETALGLAVIVAGQEVPDYKSAGWRNLARHLALKPITEIEHWEPWVDRHYPDFRQKRADLGTVLMYARGIPLVVSNVCEVISKS